MTNIKWKKVVEPLILERITERGNGRPYASIRSVYYDLGSMSIIPLTPNSYKTLDNLITSMRKSGAIRWGYFPVMRGTSGPEPPDYVPPDEFIADTIGGFLATINYYELPVWKDQHYLVELWVEKAGMLPIMERAVGNMQVQCRALEGFTPWEFANVAINDIRYRAMKMRTYPKIIILYYGDLDPSGWNIYDGLHDVFSHFKMAVTMERLGINPDQVEKYGLPPNSIDPGTQAKSKRDSRYNGYIKWLKQQGYGELNVELDALAGMRPEVIDRDVQEAIHRYFDGDVFQKVREEFEWQDRPRVEQLFKEFESRLRGDEK